LIVHQLILLPQVTPYQRALLARGIRERADVEDQLDPKSESVIGYAGSVGTEAFQEISNTNEVVRARLQRLQRCTDEPLGC
jgi:hypothetical protein